VQCKTKRKQWLVDFVVLCYSLKMFARVAGK